MAESPERLTRAAFDVCGNRALIPTVSVVSLSELIIKAQKGRITLDPDPLQWWNRTVRLLGYPVLPLRQSHVEKLWGLPFLHKDPSDRLLIAQAMAEGIPIVTPDISIRQYSVEAIW